MVYMLAKLIHGVAAVRVSLLSELVFCNNSDIKVLQTHTS